MLIPPLSQSRLSRPGSPRGRHQSAPIPVEQLPAQTGCRQGAEGRGPRSGCLDGGTRGCAIRQHRGWGATARRVSCPAYPWDLALSPVAARLLGPGRPYASQVPRAILRVLTVSVLRCVIRPEMEIRRGVGSTRRLETTFRPGCLWLV